MLIGDVLYYRRDGNRRGCMDMDVSAGYAERASRDNKDIVQWNCTNGDPADVRYFTEGRSVDAGELRQITNGAMGADRGISNV